MATSNTRPAPEAAQTQLLNAMVGGLRAALPDVRVFDDDRTKEIKPNEMPAVWLLGVGGGDASAATVSGGQRRGFVVRVHCFACAGKDVGAATAVRRLQARVEQVLAGMCDAGGALAGLGNGLEPEAAPAVQVDGDGEYVKAEAMQPWLVQYFIDPRNPFVLGL